MESNNSPRPRETVRFTSEPSAPPESMSSWLERQASSHQVQLAATAVISGVAVAGLIYGSQAIRRKAAVNELKASIPELNESHHAERVRSPTLQSIRVRNDLSLTVPVKLTDYGGAAPLPKSSNEDDRAAALARRAQQGDYSQGITTPLAFPEEHN